MTKRLGDETRQQRRAKVKTEVATSTSLQELFTSAIPQEKVILFSGVEYVFEYKDVPWGAFLKHIEAAWVSVNGVDRFNIEQYYEDMLLDALVSFPDGSNPTRSILKKFHPEVFFQLQDIIPKPSFGSEIDEVKKASKVPLEMEEEEEILEEDN